MTKLKVDIPYTGIELLELQDEGHESVTIDTENGDVVFPLTHISRFVNNMESLGGRQRSLQFVFDGAIIDDKPSALFGVYPKDKKVSKK